MAFDAGVTPKVGDWFLTAAGDKAEIQHIDDKGVLDGYVHDDEDDGCDMSWNPDGTSEFYGSNFDLVGSPIEPLPVKTYHVTHVIGWVAFRVKNAHSASEAISKASEAFIIDA